MIVRHYLDPFTEINAIRRQINDVFGELAGNTPKADWTPALRVVDQGNEFVLKVTLAGVNADDLDIQVSNDAVVISGERKAESTPDDGKLLYEDVRYGHFHRQVNLPDAIQNNNVEANFDNGILTLTLPKVVEAQNKVVKINLGELKDTESRPLEADKTDNNFH